MGPCHTSQKLRRGVLEQGEPVPIHLNADPEPSSHQHKNPTCNPWSLVCPEHRVDGGVELV